MRYLLCTFIFLFSLTYAQYVPDFGPEIVLKYTNGTAYTPGDGKPGSSPTMVDWDGDGKRDLLIGEYKQGRTAFLKNINSDADPKFDQRDYLKDEGGAEITTSSA